CGTSARPRSADRLLRVRRYARVRAASSSTSSPGNIGIVVEYFECVSAERKVDKPLPRTYIHVRTYFVRTIETRLARRCATFLKAKKKTVQLRRQLMHLASLAAGRFSVAASAAPLFTIH